jgi:hypothetical protein
VPRVEEADELYGLPLDEFVAARTALAKRLRQEGRADEAAEVGGLRKPSLALWAVNRAARRRAAELEALLAAADRVRGGDPDGDQELRGAVASLAETAAAELRDAGHAASDGTLQRVATTLRAAAASEGEERRALARGALDRELEPAGFEAMAALAAARPPRSAPGTPDGRSRRDAELRARVEEAERALAAARDREREARAEAERRARDAERARREADRAAADVEGAERALERARSRAGLSE